MTKARLLDDDEEEQEFEPTIVVNEQFAKRFEHNKKREELHRLQEKHPELAARLARKAAAETARAARQAGGSAAAAYEDEDEDEESSSEDDDDEELLENDDTDKVLETLVRIKRKDPVIFQKDVVLFPEETAADADGEAAAAAGEHKKEKGSSKPLYLRTVLAKQALEGAAASSDDEDDNDNGIPKQPVSHSYAAEQQELKKAFLQAAEQALDGNEGEDAAAKDLVKKRRAAAAAGEGEAAAAGGAGKEQQVNELLDEYFGRDAELTEADAFLKAYLANKAWKSPADGDALGGASGSSRKRLRGIGDDDDGSSSSGSGSEDEGGGGVQGAGGVDEEEDEQFLEQVDRFEAAYNFRFEEPNSHRIQSFPRVIEDSVRRPDERRKRQRQAKAERQAAEREEREAELRRLKNLKKEEINDMLARIEKEAGIQPAAKPAAAAAGKAAKGSGSSSSSGKGGAKFAGLLDELLEGDFDPEEYDRRMAEAFDDDYYEGEEDAHELFGDAEEELAAEEDIEAVTDPSSAGAACSFAALRQKLKQQQRQQQQHGSDEDASDEDQQGDSSNDEEEEEEGDGEGTASKAEKAAQRAQQRSQLQRLLEDYYKLDYEDNIGGLACRFKYREVPAESFGLTDEDVLALSDRQLNQIAGLRLLAPYREDSKRLRPNYKALQSIKGEAAAAAAMRRQKREREKQKEWQKKQQPKQQQQGDEAQQQQQKPPPPPQQQQGQKKQMFGQQGQHQRSHHQQQQQQQHRHKQHHQQQQQKPLAEMTAEEKQAARLASYAKLTLKPSKQAQEQAEGLAGAAAAGGKGSKKRRAEQQQEGGEQQQQQKKKQKGPAVQPGRLAAAGVQLEAPLTKAQKKNLLRALKRKEKQQGQGKVPEADA
ncbi:hypothetical protein OEZ85_014286 [Tetradesmus obliquus]|uniref:Kri1-like C-terminal domain-containing protein n=1 Tax=Tetradesmus obliquus TaxID=3088 RepID=A0ABY8UAG5_TETOB|nr:hypothetical protein OEZ85_014286 [Tetradesmus obliquus]